MKLKKFFPIALLTLSFGSAAFLTGCGKDDKAPTPDNPIEPVIPGTNKTNGVFIINEGSSTGAVSYFKKENKQLTPDLFDNVNGRPAGSYLQSMTVHNNKGYIVAGGSNRVEIVDITTFQSVGVINGLKIPRYFATKGTRGYLTEHINFTGTTPGQVSVIDLNTNTVVKTITVGVYPEQLLIKEDKLFVTNSGGNTVSVINLATETVASTIPVGTAPNSLVIDAAGKLWVLCGEVYGTTDGKLVRINPATNAIEQTLNLPSGTASPQDLIINAVGTMLYYTYNKQIYALATTATTLPATPLVNRNFYDLGVDPQDNTLYGAWAAPDFVSKGKVIRYNSAGSAIDSFTVEVAPNSFIFR